MISPIFTETCLLPPISEKEVLRYAGDQNPTDETLTLLRDCIAECGGIVSDKVVYRILPTVQNEGKLHIGSMEILSKDLAKNLKYCDRVLILAASAGLAIDRLIAKYAILSPAKSLMLHSIGAERVEALCDAFCKKISEQEGIKLKPRFSPGYGDLALAYQKDILTVLNAGNTLGIGLNESMLLSPSKSVTAFAGIVRKERDENEIQ